MFKRFVRPSLFREQAEGRSPFLFIDATGSAQPYILDCAASSPLGPPVPPTPTGPSHTVGPSPAHPFSPRSLLRLGVQLWPSVPPSSIGPGWPTGPVVAHRSSLHPLNTATGPLSFSNQPVWCGPGLLRYRELGNLDTWQVAAGATPASSELTPTLPFRGPGREVPVRDRNASPPLPPSAPGPPVHRDSL